MVKIIFQEDYLQKIYPTEHFFTNFRFSPYIITVNHFY